MKSPEELQRRCDAVKRLHWLRRALEQCIQNADHGKAYRGGRCRRCWSKKKRRERELYAERKGR